jgi:hypothetical protein
MWLGCLCLVTASYWSAGICAAADSPEDVLKSSGLKQSGPLYILEAEADAKKKLSEVKQLSRQLKYAKLQRQSFGTAQNREAYIRNMTAQINQIKAESNAVGQQMNQLPRYGGRYGGRYGNYYNQGQRAQMQAYRNQLNAEVNQQNALLNQIKSHPFDSKTKDKLDAEATSKQDEYRQAVTDLVQLVKATHEKYIKLAKDEGVKKALVALELKIRPSPKLGPSREFHDMLKTVERLEKEAPADPFSDSKPTTAPTHKSRRSKSLR